MFSQGPILIEGVLVPGGALTWGIWELRSLAKLRMELERKEREAEAAKAEEPLQQRGG